MHGETVKLFHSYLSLSKFRLLFIGLTIFVLIFSFRQYFYIFKPSCITSLRK